MHRAKEENETIGKGSVDTYSHQNTPTIDGDGVRIGGRTLSIPGYTLIRKLGQGANAVVFEAFDDTLCRNVAVKIWNSRGIQRSQSEAAKIAGMNHQFIVSTYYFGRVEGHPYCVMEMVPGVSGKIWMKKKPALMSRLHVWDIYSKALQYIHALGRIHGDPHLGNVLVSIDCVKLADTGTSEFWDDHLKIEKREASIILETASLLFSQEDFDRLWQHPSGLDYKETLAILQSVSEYLQIVNGIVDWDLRGIRAGILSDLLFENPFFDINVVISQIEQTGITTSDRFLRRLNSRLHNINDIMKVSDEIDQQTIALYLKRRKELYPHVASIT